MSEKTEKSRIIDPFYSREAKRYNSPIASREYILKLLNKSRGLSLKQINDKLDYKDSARIQALKNRVHAMERDAQIVLTANQKFIAVSRLERVQGSYLRRRDGSGCVLINGEEVHVSGFSANLAMQGDIIEVALYHGIHNIEKGVITAIKTRKNKSWVAEVISVRKDECVANLFLLNQEYRVNFASDGCKIAVGDFVKLILNGKSKQKSGTLSLTLDRNLGDYLSPQIVGEMIADQSGVTREISDKVTKEMDVLSTKTIDDSGKTRRDLTSMNFVTIDGEDAKDFDDAVYVNEQDGGYKLYVAIADVSSFVVLGGAIDKQAYERATSVYFPGFVIPMLPKELADDLCSLKPDCERLTLACEISINANGEMTKYEFYHALIRSKRRYSYTEVNAIINNEKQEQDSSLSHSLAALHSLCQLMLRKRQERGALDFGTPLVSIDFASSNGPATKVNIGPRNIAHQMIEEAMLLANIVAAKFLLSEYGSGIFRNHPEPAWEKFEALKVLLARKGIDLGTQSGSPTPQQYLQLLNQIAGRDDQRLLETLILRSLPRANYDNENIGHFGLAFDEYTHFTSPIRRYPDLVVHRLISSRLTSAKDPKFDLKSISEHCSTFERKAEGAERIAILFHKCCLLRDKIGSYDYGIITGVMPFGLFILLESTQAEGMIHISNLRGYSYRPNDYCFSTRAQDKVLQLGARVKVKITAVNLLDRHVRLALVSGAARNKD